LELTEKEYLSIQKIIKFEAGIDLTDKKKGLVVNRLQKRLLALKLQTFESYLSYLGVNSDLEIPNLINVLTTNLTSFNRESHHFDFMFKEVLPLVCKGNFGSTFRVLSAGCSTGEEAISVLMMIERFKLQNPYFSYCIEGVDIDYNVVNFAKRGVYGVDSFDVPDIELNDVRRCFNKGVKSNDGFYSLKKEFSSFLSFRQGSLFGDFDKNIKYDVIFCRNVLIYFDLETQIKALEIFSKVLNDDGYLFLGHSESLQGRQNYFELLGKTIYRKKI
jgi:chemotaxis protein methyltransferase CheR